MSNKQRNAEIWSTRIQRELLALTTDDADAETTEEVRVVLPPFCTVKDHTLNLEQGTCVVSFQVEVNKDEEEKAVIIVSLDASMPKKRDGTIDSMAASYPFAEPIATLQSGQETFPQGSTIQDGDPIAMDLDWTPSLHLTDAVLNIGLKIKESILQKEPFHPAPPSMEPQATAVDEVAKGARRFASSIGKAFTSPPARKARQAKKRPQSIKEVRMGDEINLLEEPWVDSHGVYSCKAIRRPKFVEEALAKATDNDDQQAFSSPTAMFRSFTSSARNVLTESFLLITETHIIEMRASKLNMSTGKVTLAIPIDLLAKLKFRRQESISLFFKPAPDDPLIYMCPDSGDAVYQIQAVLKRYGVKGKHTNAAAHRAINEALQLVQEIQTKELALKHDPTVERVNDIMDLYRQAAERFEVAGDIRHEEVVTHMRKFLALPLTAAILDGSYQKPESERKPSAKDGGGVPEGEVLERTEALLNADDDDTHHHSKEKEKENDKAFEENIDNLLKEAQEDVQKLKVEDEPSLDDDGGLADVAADLDAMMKQADQQLAELMNS